MPAPKEAAGAPIPAWSAPIGRNRRCPCGSGRKFKFCCGIRDSSALGLVAHPGPVVHPGPGLGALTEFSGLRRATEEFGRISPDLQIDGDGVRVPPRRSEMAERKRQRGVRMAERGQRAAALVAFTQATRLDPQNAAAHLALGRALLEAGRAAEAAESLRLATALCDDAAAYRDLGAALRRQRLDHEAVAAYRRAAALAPDMTEADAGLADLLELLGDHEEAAQLCRRAATLAPHNVTGRLYLARALMLEGNFAAAETKLRAALLLEPENDRVHKLLGDVLVRLGCFDEAVARFDHVLALNPRHVSAYFTTAEARKCGESDRPRLARALTALGDPSLNDEERLLLHFAAGKMLDEFGEYPVAMTQFDAANRIRGQFAMFDGTAFAADVECLVQRFTPDLYAASRDFGVADETPVLIVGLPRSGTTLVEQILSRHPQIGAGGEQPFWLRRATGHGTLEAT